MEPQVKRNKKSDKAKKTHELTGGFSQKHIRLMEALKAKGVKTPARHSAP
jgi:hypothetical protein